MPKIHDLYLRSVRAFAGKVALEDPFGDMTYAALDSAVDVAASALKAKGLQAGDRLVLVGENSIALCVLLFAASRVGASTVISNARLSAAEIDRIVAHAEPRLIAFTTQASTDAQRHAERHQATKVSWPDDAVSVSAGTVEPRTEDARDLIARDVAVILYTSGTSGNPKGVLLTHANLTFLAESVVRGRHLSSNDRSYGVGPYAHIAGLQQLFGILSVGGTSLIRSRYDAAQLADALSNQGLTVLGGVPAVWTKLFDWYRKEGVTPHAPHLRCATGGGAPITTTLKDEVKRAFNLNLNNTYGMTEATPIAYTLMDPPRPDTSVGPPAVGMEIRIVGVDGKPVARGEVGELHVRGSAVMAGYFRNPELTAAAMDADGWLNTGDLARQEADSALFIVGRTKELIIRSGFNVYPVEVEEVLNAHAGVRQSAVVGRNVAEDEEVVAFVEVNPGTSVAELTEFLRKHLAPYKIPSTITIMDQMPASATGKILKNRLREMAQEKTQGGA